MTAILDSSKNGSATDNQPYATSSTTPPRDTFHDVSIAPGGGVLVYWPERNSFLALFAEEYRELYVEADENSKKIARLQAANRGVTEAGIALRSAHRHAVVSDIRAAEIAYERAVNEMSLARDDVKKVLSPLAKLDAKEGVKLLELVALKKGKAQPKAVPIYVKSTALKKVLADNRIYLLDGEKQKPVAEKIFNGLKPNLAALKRNIERHVQDQVEFSKKWKFKPEDADEYSGVLFDWAKTMNATVAQFCERTTQEVEKNRYFDPQNPHRNFDLSAEAQLMRYAAGAGLEVNFKPFTGDLHDQRDLGWPKRIVRGFKSGEFGIKANAHATFAAAEGRIRTGLYLPNFAGWHATAKIADQTFELGYWRFELDIILAGAVGASLAIEGDIEVTYTGGKQGLRGIPAQDRAKPRVKVRAGAGAELDVFAGARVGVDAKGALQWLNPEGADSNGKPLAIKQDQPVAEYKDIAKVNTGVACLVGVGLKLGFKIAHEAGRFVIYAKIGACVQYGVETSLKFEVETETMFEFCKCVAYQLKRADYHKITDVIEVNAYRTLCQIKYLVIAGGRHLEEFVNKQKDELELECEKVSQAIDAAIKAGTSAAEDFVKRIHMDISKQTGGWTPYAPPEVLGKIQRQLTSIRSVQANNIQGQAAQAVAMALAAPQTLNQLATIAERMTDRMGDKQDARIGYAIIESFLAGTENEGQLALVERRLADVSPLNSGPFIWNSEPEFMAARTGIEHPMFRA